MVSSAAPPHPPPLLPTHTAVRAQLLLLLLLAHLVVIRVPGTLSYYYDRNTWTAHRLPALTLREKKKQMLLAAKCIGPLFLSCITPNWCSSNISFYMNERLEIQIWTKLDIKHSSFPENPQNDNFELPDLTDINNLIDSLEGSSKIVPCPVCFWKKCSGDSTKHMVSSFNISHNCHDGDDDNNNGSRSRRRLQLQCNNAAKTMLRCSFGR
ncbi:hypothetical protein F2P81_000527 [Scophthalmus maximus]|uniref:Uncharacterized protein n=1 Tax=Scophthalmus maximus TaxID=52904 RepID=A0A6A4TUL1_SCOMX|nr:hypothetical protein F2P81_000527 [Scophthalmus maximus]